jgi:broad specificity phosphatase PhoE
VTLYLARHGDHAEAGHVLSGRSDIGLSDGGLAQARALGALCQAREVTAVQSSPRPRTCQTAQIIADMLGLDLEIVDALDEIDFGCWTGRSFAELESDERWLAWNNARDLAVPPEGESMAAAVSRAVSHFVGLHRAGRSHVLCVSHCDIIRGTIAHYLGLGLDRLLRFDIDLASLSTIAIGHWGGRLLRLNEVPA